MNKYANSENLIQFPIMRIYLLLISLSLWFFNCHEQKNRPNENIKVENDLTFINNQKLKYAIALIACDTCAPIRDIGLRVIVPLSKEEEETIKKITPNTWIELLNDNKTDWAANLILYSLYDKDAFILSKNDDKETWDKYLKKEDLDFWNKELKRYLPKEIKVRSLYMIWK